MRMLPLDDVYQQHHKRQLLELDQGSAGPVTRSPAPLAWNRLSSSAVEEKYIAVEAAMEMPPTLEAALESAAERVRGSVLS